ncbi:MAG: class I SAM-dependent methyltransferase [Pseudomonadota bacterium]
MSKLWTDIQRAWSRMGPPLRPNVEVVAGIKESLSGHRDRLLILGVTPEFADLAADVLAVDASPNMIAAIWPGDTEARRAVEGNWADLPCDDSSRQSAVCDGGLTLIPYPDGYATIFKQLSRVLEPGGRAIFRLFCVPSLCESLEELSDATWEGKLRSIHALKFRLAMARAAETGSVNMKLRDVWDDFTARFPDRMELAQVTGWSEQAIDTIDFYRDSDTVYSYPTEEQVLAIAREQFPNASLKAVGTYEMAERAPLLIMDKE